MVAMSVRSCTRQEVEATAPVTRYVTRDMRADFAELVKALRDCVEAQQPMAQARATERARAVLARVTKGG